MKTIVLFAASAALIGLCACTPPADKYGHWGKQAQPMKTLAKLDCPEEKGGFKRTSTAPDGLSCTYSGDDDSTLELKLVKVSGDVDATLGGVENELHALVPVNPSAPAAPKPPEAPAAAGAPQPPAPPTPPSGVTNVSMHPAGAKLPNGRSGDHEEVNIDLPGLHIHTKNDNAKVRVAGIHIDADDKSDTAHVEGKNPMVGSFKVDAHEGVAVVRIDNSDINIRRRVQFSSDTAGPQGDYSSGYVARGPRSGPLVVAVVRVKSHHHDDDIYDDATDLAKDVVGR